MPKGDTNDGHAYEFYRLGYGREERRTVGYFHATQIDHFVTDKYELTFNLLASECEHAGKMLDTYPLSSKAT